MSQAINPNQIFKWIRTEHGAVLLLNNEGVEQLKTIMARACNTWDTAPVSVFELHDLVIHGNLLQDYQGKSTMPKRREELTPDENMKLDRYASKSSQSGE